MTNRNEIRGPVAKSFWNGPIMFHNSWNQCISKFLYMCEYCIRILRNEDLIFAFQFYELLFSIMKLCLQIVEYNGPQSFLCYTRDPLINSRHHIPISETSCFVIRTCLNWLPSITICLWRLLRIHQKRPDRPIHEKLSLLSA